MQRKKNSATGCSSYIWTLHLGFTDSSSMSSRKKSSKKRRQREDASALLHPMLANVVARTIHVSCYQDLNSVETEIASILRCQEGKMPPCISTEAFQRFRRDTLLSLVACCDGEQNDLLVVDLEQGLFLSYMPKEKNVQLIWREACCAGAQISPEHELVPLELKFVQSFAELSVR